ncbi:MAG: hypothetical protein PVI75_00705 [Gammaproteobacteria bacterium]|jgi:hypothetical protein
MLSKYITLKELLNFYISYTSYGNKDTKLSQVQLDLLRSTNIINGYLLSRKKPFYEKYKVFENQLGLQFARLFITHLQQKNYSGITKFIININKVLNQKSTKFNAFNLEFFDIDSHSIQNFLSEQSNNCVTHTMRLKILLKELQDDGMKKLDQSDFNVVFTIKIKNGIFYKTVQINKWPNFTKEETQKIFGNPNDELTYGQAEKLLALCCFGDIKNISNIITKAKQDKNSYFSKMIKCLQQTINNKNHKKPSEITVAYSEVDFKQKILNDKNLDLASKIEFLLELKAHNEISKLLEKKKVLHNGVLDDVLKVIKIKKLQNVKKILLDIFLKHINSKESEQEKIKIICKCLANENFYQMLIKNLSLDKMLNKSNNVSTSCQVLLHLPKIKLVNKKLHIFEILKICNKDLKSVKDFKPRHMENFINTIINIFDQTRKEDLSKLLTSTSCKEAKKCLNFLFITKHRQYVSKLMKNKEHVKNFNTILLLFKLGIINKPIAQNIIKYKINLIKLESLSKLYKLNLWTNKQVFSFLKKRPDLINSQFLCNCIDTKMLTKNQVIALLNEKKLLNNNHKQAKDKLQLFEKLISNENLSFAKKLNNHIWKNAFSMIANFCALSENNPKLFTDFMQNKVFLYWTVLNTIPGKSNRNKYFKKIKNNNTTNISLLFSNCDNITEINILKETHKNLTKIGNKMKKT